MLCLAMTITETTATAAEPSWPRVCHDPQLREAMRIIDAACEELKSCDPTTLKRLDTNVDKPTLLAALRDPNLKAVHVFFEPNKYKIEDVKYWNEWKRDQLGALKFVGDPTEAVVFVLGQASITGNPDHNIKLSRERMMSVMNYLQNVLKIKCHAFHGGWLGSDIFQLTPSDASHLNINGDDYDHDAYTLNQSVHVFVYPCASLLR